MWEKIKLIILNIVGFFVANPVFFYLLIGLIVLGIIAGQISSCNSRREEKKIEQIKENIAIDKIESNVLSNQKEGLKNEANHIQQNVNQAANNFNNSVRRGSNQFDGANAGRRFCQRFPDDPSCQ